MTDADFNVLGSAKTTPSQNLSHASFVAEVAEPDDHLVLARDEDWQNPMTFDVTIDLSEGL